MAQTKPTPMSFAVMRNAHEVIRHTLADLTKSLEEKDVSNAKTHWENHIRYLRTHAKMEDEGLFQLLDKLSGTTVISNEKLNEEHTEDERLHSNVDEAFKTGELEKVSEAFVTYKDFHLKHLKHEEDILMPLTPKSGANPEERGKVFAKEVLSKVGDDFDWFLEYSVKTLARGTATHNGQVGTSVFVHGLQYASTEKQWEHWLPIVKNSTTTEIWDYMVSNCDIESAGKIVEAQ
eukprot:c33497_g1_i1.p1 GENE.c33497_g1_i1~~c33497_g1_i1.p1  ORF type:complete len:244 (+),score=121.53 c33497_g1_i1:33-734(+)